jgi:hypothetical protein
VFTSNAAPNDLYATPAARPVPAGDRADRTSHGARERRWRTGTTGCASSKRPALFDVASHTPMTPCGLDSKHCRRCGQRGRQRRDRGPPDRRAARTEDVIWFDFAAVCDGPRSQSDYVEIARLSHGPRVERAAIRRHARKPGPSVHRAGRRVLRP